MIDIAPQAPIASRGHVEIEERAPGVLVYRLCGYLDSDVVPQLIAAADAQVARGRKVELFFDTDTMTGNESRFRHRMTEWHNALKPETRALHVYVRSRIVAMSVSVVKMVIGSLMTSYDDRAQFESALQAAVDRASA